MHLGVQRIYAAFFLNSLLDGNLTVYLLRYVFAYNKYACIPLLWQKYIAVKELVNSIGICDGFSQIVLGKSGRY